MNPSLPLLKVCCGVDVSAADFHCRLLGLAAGDLAERSLGRRKFANDAAGHADFIRWLGERSPAGVAAVVVVEATGVYHEALAYAAHAAGVRIAVELPNKIAHFARSFNEHSKTDPKDALAVARFGLYRDVRAWEPFSPRTRALKLLAREYQQLEAALTRARGQRHARSRTHGGSPASAERLAARIALLEDQREAVLAEMKAVAAADERLARGVAVLTSIYGVGERTALAVLGETDGFRLFTTRAQLIKYAGYDVVERQSGTSVSGRTRISKRGNAALRKALFFPSMRARERGIFAAVYARQLERSGRRMSALVAVQRKLLITMYALVKRDEFYVEDYHKRAPGDVAEGRSAPSVPRGKGAGRPEDRPAVAAPSEEGRLNVSKGKKRENLAPALA